MKTGLSSILDSLSNKFWVERQIDEAVEKSIKPHELTDHYYPSMAGSCPRLIQLTMFGLVKSTIDYKLQRMFDNGNSVHERYSKYFKSIGRLDKEEISFRFNYKGIICSGRADLIIEDYQSRKYIGEIKSMNNRRFTELLGINAPTEENFLQWNIYSHALKLPEGFILYENKDDQRLLIFPVTFDEMKFHHTMDIFLYVESYNKKEELVPKPDKCPNGYYCQAASFCKSPDVKLFNDAIMSLMIKNKKGGN